MCEICNGEEWLFTDDEIEVGIEDGKLEIEVNGGNYGEMYEETWKKKINYCMNCGKDLREVQE